MDEVKTHEWNLNGLQTSRYGLLNERVDALKALVEQTRTYPTDKDALRPYIRLTGWLEQADVLTLHRKIALGEPLTPDEQRHWERANAPYEERN